MVHPDMQEALKSYNGNGDSFKEMFRQREIMVQKGMRYWNGQWDDFYKYWAREATKVYAKRQEWPENGKQKTKAG